MPQMRFGLRQNGMSWSRLKNAVAAGHVAVKSDALDLNQNDCIAFMVLMGAIAGVPTIKLQGSDTNVDGNFQDLEGSGVTFVTTDDNKVMQIEVSRPTTRYTRVVISPDGVNDFVIDGILGCTYNGRSQPPAHGTGINALSFMLHSPEVGTA